MLLTPLVSWWWVNVMNFVDISEMKNQKSALLVCFKYSSSTRYSRSHLINVFLLKYLPNLISKLWCIFLKIPKLFFGSSHQHVLCRKIDLKILEYWKKILVVTKNPLEESRTLLQGFSHKSCKIFRRQDIVFLKHCSMLNS